MVYFVDMKWKAHAKLNLALDITGMRPDGYHLIDTIIQEISLYDDIDIVPADSIQIDCPGIEAENNIARAAAEAFFHASGIRAGVYIQIQKHIPVGAGLGGGSSDAAAVLCALNQLYGRPLRQAQLLGEAVRLGADVPACIIGGTLRARGIGDEIEQIENRCRMHFLLVKPERSISTAQAYRLYDMLPAGRVDIAAAERALQDGDVTAFCAAAGNVLLSAALMQVPEIAQAGQDCLDSGAEAWMLTGSGSCIFSIFRNRDRRERARQKLAGRYPFVCAADAYNAARSTQAF